MKVLLFPEMDEGDDNQNKWNGWQFLSKEYISEFLTLSASTPSIINVPTRNSMSGSTHY